MTPGTTIEPAAQSPLALKRCPVGETTVWTAAHAFVVAGVFCGHALGAGRLLLLPGCDAGNACRRSVGDGSGPVRTVAGDDTALGVGGGFAGVCVGM